MLPEMGHLLTVYGTYYVTHNVNTCVFGEKMLLDVGVNETS